MLDIFCCSDKIQEESRAEYNGLGSLIYDSWIYFCLCLNNANLHCTKNHSQLLLFRTTVSLSWSLKKAEIVTIWSHLLRWVFKLDSYYKVCHIVIYVKSVTVGSYFEDLESLYPSPQKISWNLVGWFDERFLELPFKWTSL